MFERFKGKFLHRCRDPQSHLHHHPDELVRGKLLMIDENSMN